MKYKREETFRYVIVEKLNCKFKIISARGQQFDSSYSNGDLLDISPSGLKIFSPLDISPQKNVVFYVEFTLNNQPIKLNATLIWKKNVGNGYQYGLKHHGSKEEVRMLIEELKIYAKKQPPLK
ncbi:PilZ domain-containing protein [Bacillaceae bacterium IKA-2]|nr:PilZ domain-containing protein [Bacillaceae bacterium IKA-2]